MLCPLRVGWVHFALLAGSHSAFSLKRERRRPCSPGSPVSHPKSEKQLLSSGAGNMPHSELRHLPEHQAEQCCFLHRTWTPPMAFSSQRKKALTKKKDSKKVGEIRKSIMWESQIRMLGRLVNRISASAFLDTGCHRCHHCCCILSVGLCYIHSRDSQWD